MEEKEKDRFHVVKSVEASVLVVMGVGMTVIMFANVVGRYLFKNTFIWAEETVRILFVAAMFIAVTTGFIRNEHIGFNVLKTKNRTTRMLCDYLYDLSLILIGGIMAWFGFQYTVVTGGVLLAGTDLPEAVLLLPGVVAGAVWFLLGVTRLVKRLLQGGPS